MAISEDKKIEILGKLITGYHEKILILMGSIAGLWYYGIEFIKVEYILFTNILGIILLISAVLLVFGLISIYVKLSIDMKELRSLKDV